MNASAAIEPFAIKGADVDVASLLQLQLLAHDTARLFNDRTRSRKAGDQRSMFRGQGREFIEMKHYQMGDDVRRIDWKLTARKQQPFVRVMEEDRHAEQAIWLNLSSSSFFGTQRCLKSVMLVHWAAFLVWRFLHLKHPLRIIIQVGNTSKELTVSNKAQAAFACQALIECHDLLASQFKFFDSAPSFNWPTHWHSRPNLWVLSDFLQDDLDELQMSIPHERVNRVNLLQVTDQFDLQYPKAGQLAVSHNNKTTFINASNQQARSQHEQQALELQNKLSEIAFGFNGQFIHSISQQFQWQDVSQWSI